MCSHEETHGYDFQNHFNSVYDQEYEIDIFRIFGDDFHLVVQG
jgi:hypothetical protein